MATKIKYPNIFAMTGNLSVSNGLMYGVKEDGTEIPVEVTDKRIKGANSASIDEKKKPEEIVGGNLQHLDTANLPTGTETLRLKFGIKIIPYIFRPSSCNIPEYRDELGKFVGMFIDKGGMKTLSEKYAEQILSGDYLWRNKFSLGINVSVECKNKNEVITAKNDNGNYENFQELSEIIEKTLSEKDSILFVRVIADSLMDEFSEVYPSQEFISESSKTSSGKTKTLFDIKSKYEGRDIRHAAMHSQKIGNALRKIDNWYGENVDAISVEPYGIDQETSTAHRHKKNSFYDYAKKLDSYNDLMENNGVQDCHLFFMACLIRGGVFGASKEK